MKRKVLKIFIISFTLLLAMDAAYIGTISSNQAYAVGEEDSEDKNGAPILHVPENLDFSEYKIIETYDTEWPQEYAFQIQYDKYTVYPHYVVNISYSRSKVYTEPDTRSDRLSSIKYGEKAQVVALIEDDIDTQWYAVVREEDDEYVIGYVRKDHVYKREFQLDKMFENLDHVTAFHDLGHIVYVENYKNANGRAPRMPNGSYYDDFGYRRGQSAAGYYDSSLEGEFRYIPDGMLGIVEEVIEQTENEDYLIVMDNKGVFTDSTDYKQYINIDEDYEPPKRDDDDEEDKEDMTPVELYNDSAQVTAVKVYIPSFGVSLWVQDKYLNEDEDAPDVLNQTIIVDRKNQTIGVFEYDDEWKIISLSYSSTGKVGEFSLPTPLGFYMAITKKKKFDWVEDGTNDIVGFAPYAIRFSGGGYLHGVPMDYGFTESGNKISPTVYQEYLASIGTIPRSHMCVRNYTSHAEFMYHWVDIGNCAIIVIE